MKSEKDLKEKESESLNKLPSRKKTPKPTVVSSDAHSQEPEKLNSQAAIHDLNFRMVKDIADRHQITTT